VVPVNQVLPPPCSMPPFHVSHAGSPGGQGRETPGLFPGCLIEGADKTLRAVVPAAGAEITRLPTASGADVAP
jgi:hypothetical protein